MMVTVSKMLLLLCLAVGCNAAAHVQVIEVATVLAVKDPEEDVQGNDVDDAPLPLPKSYPPPNPNKVWLRNRNHSTSQMFICGNLCRPCRRR